jgi:hypothetical protein
MTNELMNMQDLKEKITENVKLNFFNLIPNDKFEKLVNDEIKAFFETTSENFTIRSINNYNKISELTTPISPFRAIIWNQCRDIVITRLEKHFQSPEFQIGSEYIDGEYKAALSEKFEKVLEEKANKLAATFFKDMFAMAIQSSIPDIVNATKNSISNRY